MASPEPTPQPTPTEQLQDDAAVIAQLSVAIAEATTIAELVLPPALLALLLRMGLRRDAIQAAAALTLRGPLYRTPARGSRASGTAAAQVAAQEPEMRARYLLAAARRITRDLRTVTPRRPGEKPPPPGQRLADAIRRERRFWRQHLDAQRNRRRAAHEVDLVALVSPWMQWQTANDARVEQDCRHLAGRTFTIADPPRLDGHVVWPGAVHPHCRCRAVPVVDPALFGSAPTITY